METPEKVPDVSQKVHVKYRKSHLFALKKLHDAAALERRQGSKSGKFSFFNGLCSQFLRFLTYRSQVLSGDGRFARIRGRRHFERVCSIHFFTVYRNAFFRSLYGLFEGLAATYCEVYTPLFRGPEFSEASEFESSQIGFQNAFKIFFVSDQISVTFLSSSI